jgi:hypothetical protein
MRVEVPGKWVDAAKTIKRETPRKPIGDPQLRIFAKAALVTADTVQRTRPIWVVCGLDDGPQRSRFIR